MCRLQDYGTLRMDKVHRDTLNLELGLWHRSYLPKSGLEGKTILDLGAGCGETAFFFLAHGASRVVCIESDQHAARLLKENFSQDSRVDIITAKIDAIKIDIEGSERGAIIETHFPTKFKRVETINRELSVSLWRIERRRISFFHELYALRRALHRIRVSVAHRIRLLIDWFFKATARERINHQSGKKATA